MGGRLELRRDNGTRVIVHAPLDGGV
jgi:hypothetical protein